MEDVSNLFAAFDKDGKGTLTKSEVEAAIRSRNENLSDDEINQLHPQMLDDRAAWVAYHEDGKSEVVVHSFGEAIEPYSSLLLQSSIVAMIPLIFVWASQHSSEKRDSTVQ